MDRNHHTTFSCKGEQAVGRRTLVPAFPAEGRRAGHFNQGLSRVHG
ncbi:MAG: hypothetical protein HQK63_04735 [Desulfamplus sp.]|nr:hypothetical protein [Desulfamplus sp.]